MFVAMGAIGLAAGIAWVAFYRDRREVQLEPDELAYLNEGAEVSTKEGKISREEWAGILGKRTTWGIIIGWIGVIYMVYLLLTWLPGILQKERHLSLAGSVLPLTIIYAAGTLGQLSSGVVADWLLARGMKPIPSRKWPICVGLVLAAAFIVPAGYTASLTVAIGCLAAATYFVNMSSGAGWALVSVSAPRRLVATLGSFMNFGGYLAASAAPILTGFIVDKTGSFAIGLVIAAVVALVGAAANMLIVKDPITEGDALQLSPALAWTMRVVGLLVGAFVGFLANAQKGALIGAGVALLLIVAIPVALKAAERARPAA